MNHHPNHHNHSTNPNDPYAILGISPHASLSEIRSAYKQKALQYHPDKQTAKGNTDIERIQCHEQFTKINQAYQLLSDPNQRYRYDRQKQQQDSERLYERGGRHGE
jgi:curved DNA-binding protein CbpA